MTSLWLGAGPFDAPGVPAINTWLGALPGATVGSLNLTVLQSPDHQNVITLAVPEPSTWAMLLAGVAIIFAGQIRRADRRASPALPG